MRACILIPCFDHSASLGGVLDGVAPLGLPSLVVDDGSRPAERERIEALARERPWVKVQRRPANGGRGAALRDGYTLAGALGFTHVLQLDADGQHDAGGAPALLAEAARDPAAVVLGLPRFDASAPAARRYGRWVSRVWVWLETGSLAIRDPLCGIRCLPLAPLLALLEREPCGDGMEFDTEVAVRLFWAGHPFVNVPVDVRYFPEGISHFHVLRDNARLAWLHTRLFLEMLRRASFRLGRRLSA